VAGLLALAVGMGIGRFAFTPILPMMQEDAGLSIAMGGWLASANYVGYLLGALSVMGLRMRASSAIRAGLIAIGLATLAMGLDGGLVWWLVLRAIAGVASALVLINVSAWCLERLAALGRLGLTNTVFAGVGAGIVLAGGLCLALMHAGAGSSRAWTVLGATSLALVVAGLRRGGDGLHAGRRGPPKLHEQSPPVDPEPSRDGAGRRPSGRLVEHRGRHARRTSRRRHVHGHHDGRHAGGAQRGRRAGDGSDGRADLSLRGRADRRPDRRELRRRRGRRLL